MSGGLEEVGMKVVILVLVRSKVRKGGVATVIRALHVLEKLVESIGKWGVVGEGQWGRRIGSWCVK